VARPRCRPRPEGAPLSSDDAQLDPLTGLPNRRLLAHDLEAAIRDFQRSRMPFTVLYVDLDDFKPVNDEHGHAMGDRVLQQVARRLRQGGRDADTFARIGGDEFVGLLRSTDSIEGATVIARRLRASLEEPLVVDDRIVRIGASVGIALFPEHGGDAEGLIEAADRAMYRAKRSHSGIAIPEAGAASHAERDFLLATSFEEALREDRIRLEFQPRFRIGDGALQGVEALSRWDHEALGSVDPGEFVRRAERSTAIVGFTSRTLRLTRQLQAAAERSGPAPPAFVNLSVQMLRKEEHRHALLATLEALAFPPGRLVLELHDAELLDADDGAEGFCRELVARGVELALDDFGTGFTALDLLRRLPVHEFVLSGELCASIDGSEASRAIVEALARLGGRLGLRVTAKGVERQDALDALAGLGVTHAQGFALGRPEDPETLLARLAGEGPGTPPQG
jgi:diguanylate cyclase (GGDEF)-like protein